MAADRRHTLKQIERGKAFQKSDSDGGKYFAILGLYSMIASTCAAARLLGPRRAGIHNFKHRSITTR
jgi:hypothetical protein